MTLENVLLALKHGINNSLEELDEKVLQEHDVQGALTTFFAEQQARPELVSQIKSQSLMKEYLELKLEEREELEGFREANNGYFSGEGKGLKGGGSIFKVVKSKNISNFIIKQRYCNQLLRIFDFYLENREEGETFSSGYLQANKKLKKQFRNLGQRIIANSRHNLNEKRGLKFLIDLASEINPKIKKYTTFKECFKIDGVNQILRCFDFYLQNREGEKRFCSNYLRKDEKLKQELGNIGQNLLANVQTHFNEEGGIKYLVQLAAEKRPEILEYWEYREQYRI